MKPSPTRDQEAARVAAEDAHDKELMARLAAGDESALRELVEKHQGAVYGTISKMLGDPIEAQDLAQQVFVRIYRAAGTYRAMAQFRTWMFTIVRNLVFNEHRRRARATLVPLHAPDAEKTRFTAVATFGLDLPDTDGEEVAGEQRARPGDDGARSTGPSWRCRNSSGWPSCCAGTTNSPTRRSPIFSRRACRPPSRCSFRARETLREALAGLPGAAGRLLIFMHVHRNFIRISRV